MLFMSLNLLSCELLLHPDNLTLVYMHFIDFFSLVPIDSLVLIFVDN